MSPLGDERHLGRTGTWRTSRDPALQNVDLAARQRAGRERHPRFHLAGNHEVERALLGAPGDDSGTSLSAVLEFGEGLEHQPAHPGVGGVACYAVALEDRGDIRSIGRRARFRGRKQGFRQQGGSEQDRASTRSPDAPGNGRPRFRQCLAARRQLQLPPSLTRVRNAAF